MGRNVIETIMGGNWMCESNGEQAVEQQTEPKTRQDWIAHALRDLNAEFISRSIAILDAMQEEAEASMRRYIEKMLNAQRAYPPEARGSISVRVRRSAKSGPGMFQIEWYRVKGLKRTHYLKRGKDRDGKIRHGYFYFVTLHSGILTILLQSACIVILFDNQTFLYCQPPFGAGW